MDIKQFTKIKRNFEESGDELITDKDIQWLIDNLEILNQQYERLQKAVNNSMLTKKITDVRLKRVVKRQ